MNIPFTPELPSFDALFDTIANSVQKEKLVIVIDELPFLTSSYHGFISYLQGFCDKTKRENKNIKLLLSGSNMTLPLGFSTNSTYISILVAISSHKKKVKEMPDLLKIDNNALSTYLKRTLETGAIEKRTSFNGNKKNVYYEISDPFIRFYYRFIYPYLLDIDQGLGKRFIK